MLKRAAIYIRVSSESQTNNFSLPTQRSACERYAAQHGFTVVAILSDEKSGATLDRPGLNQLRELITDRTLDAVIVYAIDRLTRNRAHALLLEDALRRAGVKLHVAVANDQSSAMLLMLDSEFAAIEHQIMQERAARGRRGKNEAGSITGQGGFAPFGYRIEGKKSATHLVVDEANAAVVRLIFKLFLESNVRETRRHLQAMDVPSPVESGDYPKSIYKRRARTEWCDSSIYQILKNQTYIGQWHMYYTKIPVSVPAIVDPATFAAAQAKLAQGRALHVRRSDWCYLLRRLLRCRDCNYAMVGCHRQERLYYRCTAANNGKQCKLPHIPTRILESAVWQWIASYVLREPHLQAVSDQASVNAGAGTTQAEEERTFYMQQQADLERRMLDLADLYSAGIYSLDETRQRKVQLRRLHASIIMELHTLTERLDTTTRIRTTINHLLNITQQIQQHPDVSLSFDAQRRVLELLDVRVEVFLEGGLACATITCRLTGDAITIRLNKRRMIV